MPGAGEKRMTAEEIVKYFKVQKRLPDMSDAAAAIRTVLKFLERDQSGTVQELTEELERCRDVLCTKSDGSVASIMSGCDLVKQHMTKTDLLAFADMERGRKIMVKRGKEFLAEIEDGKARISKEASLRILDGMRILTHSRSKNVLRTLTAAHDGGKRFCVYVTQSMPDKSGSQMAKELRQHGISATEILDASVGYIMAQVDVVMVGAEGVVETGGIINKIGTYSVGLIAKSLKKPLYVLCESCKFARLYPLSEADLPLAVRHLPSTLDKEGVNLEEEHPLTDYTPPSLITYLFTDLGILVPTAVSDALLKLYL